jgi:hypothetical protein
MHGQQNIKTIWHWVLSSLNILRYGVGWEVSGVADEWGWHRKPLAQRQSVIFQKTRILSTAVRTLHVTGFIMKLIDGRADLEIYLLIVPLTK